VSQVNVDLLLALPPWQKDAMNADRWRWT